MHDAFVVLDQGGHSSRASLIDAQGRSLAQALVPIDTRRTPDERVEHDPEELVASFNTALAEIATAVAAQETVVAGLATQRSSIVCWDPDSGATLSPVISWQDRRNAALTERLRPHAAGIHARTGLVLSPHYGASKLRWCLDNLPEVREAAAQGRLCMGPLSSFLLFRLLKERPRLVDPANASRTQLWNPVTRDWEPELLQRFGVPKQHLPQPVASRHDFGTLVCGDRELPLQVCTGDQSTVPFAFGAARADTAYINIGTGAFIQRPLKTAIIAPPLLSSVVWSAGDEVLYVLEGTVNGAGSALQWFAEREGLDTSRLMATLADAQAGPPPPLFLNGISGLGSPFWTPRFDSRFVAHGRGDADDTLLQFVAVVESILFLIRLNLDEIEHHTPAGHPPLTRIVLTGGVSNSEFVCRRLANLTGLPVVRYGEHEATSRGLAYLLAGRPERWPLPPDEEVFTPREDTALLERFFAWLKAMKQDINRNA